MPKWLVLLLLEFSTLLLIINAVIYWLSRSLKMKLAIKNSNEANSNNIINAANPDDDSITYKKLVYYIDGQIQFAANSITQANIEKHDINKFKIWGTVLRAERAILLNQVSDQPQPILSRFLSSMLYALSAPKLQTTNPDELSQNLTEMQAEFYQTAELLISKESLLNHQKELNDDIRNNIDRAQKRVRQLGIKQNEEKRLELEINDLKKKILTLENQQQSSSDNTANFDYNWDHPDQDQWQSKATSYLQISMLNGLSNRQRMVIDQLKSEIKRASKKNHFQSSIEAQHVAITKLERISIESHALIFQLEEELKLSSLSIESLKQDISLKDVKLSELEQQLAKSNETAIGNLQSLTATKKETFGALREGLDTALEKNTSKNLVEQDKDAKTLERLLLESETCVTLLAQELEIAEESNEELKKQLAQTSMTESTKHLEKQRALNKRLSQSTTTLKEKLANLATSKHHQELRVSYNKKSLECDRIQLAFSDLEMKYLRTLNK